MGAKELVLTPITESAGQVGEYPVRDLNQVWLTDVSIKG